MAQPPFTMSKYASEVELLRDKCAWLEGHVAAKQARIDALMLEYCPDDMTPEQVAEWERHQVAVPSDVLPGEARMKIEIVLKPNATREDANFVLDQIMRLAPVDEGWIDYRKHDAAGIAETPHGGGGAQP